MDHTFGGYRLNVILWPGFLRDPSLAWVEVAVKDFNARGTEPRDELLLEPVTKRLVS